MSPAPKRSLHTILIVWLVLIGAACQPATPETQTSAPRSLWGVVATIAEAEQSSAPALWAEPSRVVAAWIGADSAGVHQDVRQWADGAFSPVTVLPLPPTHPYAQTLLPGSAGSLHLLWLDAGDTAGDTGETQLYSALVTSQYTVERGPTPISEMLALRYAAATDGAGRVWAAWSGGAISEPVLYVRPIDEAGRPQPPQRVTLNADYPAFARANNGTLHLFWLQGGQLMHATLRNGIVSAGNPLTSTVYLGAGDRLHNLSAGVDRSHAYVFWTITRAAGQTETWFASGTLDALVWSPPALLTIDRLPTTTFETGFNTGRASAAARGETPFTWAAPLAGQYDVLPVAAQSPDGLSVVYFQSGEPVAVQTVLEGVELIGLPALVSDRNRDLYLAWSAASPNSAARLQVTSTQH